MSERFNQLNAHHSNLRLKAALQRRHLAEISADIEHQLSGLDRGIAATKRLAKNPAVLVGGVAVVALIGPKRVMSWITKGALVYSTARRFLQLRRGR